MRAEAGAEGHDLTARRCTASKLPLAQGRDTGSRCVPSSMDPSTRHPLAMTNQACRSSRDERCSHPPAFHGKAALRRMPRKKDRRPQTAAQNLRNPKSSHGRRQSSPKWSLEGLPAAGKTSRLFIVSWPAREATQPDISALGAGSCLQLQQQSGQRRCRGHRRFRSRQARHLCHVLSCPCRCLFDQPLLGNAGGCTQSSRGLSGKIDARSQRRLVVFSHCE